MSGPETKESIDLLNAGSGVLPRADQAAIITVDGTAQLPARPPEAKKTEPSPDRPQDGLSAEAAAERLHLEQLKEKLFQLKVEDVQKLALQSEQVKNNVIATLLVGQTPAPEVIKAAEALFQLSGNAALIDQAQGGNLSQEMLAKHLLDYIRQQRSFDCSSHELAMLDSLEAHLTRLLQHINPNIRIQQQRQADADAGPDDDGGGGPERVDDDRESGIGGIEDFDSDAETAVSPRSKKGRARARDRRSRFRRWMARMMRVFRGQTLGMRGKARTRQTAARNRSRDRRFVRTVRISGRVLHAQSRAGVAGAKIVSNTLGTVETGSDGRFCFENVPYATSYSIAPIKSGLTFLPLSINDTAIDSREHEFVAE